MPFAERLPKALAKVWKILREAFRNTFGEAVGGAVVDAFCETFSEAFGKPLANPVANPFAKPFLLCAINASPRYTPPELAEHPLFFSRLDVRVLPH